MGAVMLEPPHINGLMDWFLGGIGGLQRFFTSILLIIIIIGQPASLLSLLLFSVFGHGVAPYAWLET
jgi:hypothetical protein